MRSSKALVLKIKFDLQDTHREANAFHQIFARPQRAEANKLEVNPSIATMRKMTCRNRILGCDSTPFCEHANLSRWTGVRVNVAAVRFFE
jgi:hypothetical protein